MRPFKKEIYHALLEIASRITGLSLSLFAAESPFSGTWKLNTAKSHFSGPAPKSSTATVQADDQSLNLKQEFVDDKGQTSKISVDAKFDGKDYPVTGDPDTDSMAFQRINDRELKITYKKAGQVTGRSVVIVSKDGKTTTLKGTDYKDGKPTGHGSAVYDRTQ